MSASEPRETALSPEAREELGKVAFKAATSMFFWGSCPEDVKEVYRRIGLAVRAHVLAELAKGGPLKERDRELVRMAMTMLQNSDREPVADLLGRLLAAHDSALATIAALRAELEAERGRAERAEWERSEAMKAGTPFWAERDSANALILERDQLRAALAAAERKAAEMERERDAAIRLHVVRINDRNWGVYGVPNHYAKFVDTEAEAVAFVRKAAGLASELTIK